MLPAACHSYFETSPLDPTTISMLDELPLACYCALWCGCCCYCDAGPHTRVCVLIRDGFLLNAITSFTVCVRLADLSGLDINSEQPSEKKNRIRHSPFVDARLPYSLDFSFFSILLFSRFQQAAACHPERGTFLIYCIYSAPMTLPPRVHTRTFWHQTIKHTPSYKSLMARNCVSQHWTRLFIKYTQKNCVTQSHWRIASAASELMVQTRHNKIWDAILICFLFFHFFWGVVRRCTTTFAVE